MTDERQRLASLRALMVLDSAPEPVFDTLARLASDVCGTPIGLLSLIDAERQWFKANVGLEGVSETPRELAFCDHAIRQDELFEVGDARQDPRFADNPLVTGAPDIRFYAGAPLVLSNGERVGTLCVIDRQARRLTPAQVATLKQLAQAAVQALEMRRDLIERTLAVRSAHEQGLTDSEARLRSILDAQSELVSQADSAGRLLYVNPAYAAHFGRTVASIVGSSLYDYVDPADRAMVRERVSCVLRTGQVQQGENRMQMADGSERWFSWTNTRQFDRDGQPLLHSTGRDVTARVRAERELRTSRAFLARTGRLAGVGGWQMDIASGEITWSEETRRIHEVAADFQPTLAAALAFYTPASRPLVEAAVQRGLTSGQPWDLELQVVTAKGRTIWARAFGEVEFEGRQPVRLVGAFQDITEQRALREELAGRERFLRQLADSLPVRIAHLDRARRYRFVNESWCRQNGLVREAVLGHTRAELLPGRDDTLLAAHAQAALAGQEQRFEFDDTVDGQPRRFEQRLVPDRDAAGQVQGFFLIGVDITERSLAEQALLRQTTTLRSVADAIPFTVAVLDPSGRYRLVNQAFEQLAGRPASEIVGRGAREVLGEAEFQRRRPWIERAQAGERLHFELDSDGPGGRTHTALDYVPLRLPSNALDGFVVITRDITQHRREESRLHRLSQSDPLTGLFNRAGFEQCLGKLLDERAGEPLAVLYVDLDRFKPVNDSHGHAAGDEVLRLLARRLVRLVRPSDAVARLGGDEFAVLLPGMKDPAQAERVAGSIVEAAAQPFVLASGLEVSIGASVGAALGLAQRDNWQTLLERADRMLYLAKQSGRGRVAVDADGAGTAAGGSGAAGA